MTERELKAAVQEKKERKLIKMFEQMNKTGQENLIEHAELLLGLDKYRLHPRNGKTQKVIRADFYR